MHHHRGRKPQPVRMELRLPAGLDMAVQAGPAYVAEEAQSLPAAMRDQARNIPPPHLQAERYTAVVELVSAADSSCLSRH